MPPKRLEDAITHTITGWVTKKRSPNTIKAYTADLDAITHELATHTGTPASELTLDDLDAETMNAAFARFAETRSSATVLRAASTWRTLFDRMVAIGATSASPMRTGLIDLPTAPKRSAKPIGGWGDPETIRAIFDAAQHPPNRVRVAWPEMDTLMVAVMLGTGLRVSELVALNYASIVGPADRRRIHVVGKGNKPRDIPVPPNLDPLVHTATESRRTRWAGWKPVATSPLLVAETKTSPPGGSRLTARQADYRWRSILRAAGVPLEPGTGAHAARHTFTSLCAAGGEVPLRVLQDVLGHASIATTAAYAAVADPDRRTVTNLPVWGPTTTTEP